MRDIGHPDAHGGVDGEIFDAGESLAVREGRQLSFGEFEDVRSNEFLRVGGQNELAVESGHEGRINKEGTGVQRCKGERQKQQINAEGAEVAEYAGAEIVRRTHRSSG